MRIINLVLNNFTNDSRVLKTSQTLKRLGYSVQVVAMHNEGLLEFEELDGILIHRIVLRSRKWSKNKFVQIIKFFEFVFWFKFYYGNEKFIHCNDLNALLVGVVIKIFNWKIKLIYDSHEYAINDVPNQSRLSIKLNYFLEGFLIKFPVRVINVSSTIANDYVRLYGIPKPLVILNCPNYRDQEKKNIFREKFGINSAQKIFLYQGALSPGRGIELLLKLFSSLQSENCVLVCMGYGPLEGEIIKYAALNKNIFFHKAVIPAELLNYTSSADFGLSFGEDVCLSYRFSLPNKIFEYIMAGLPVLTSNLVEMRRLVIQENVGVVAETNTIEGFRNAIYEALTLDYPAVQRNILAIRRKYSWEEQEKVLKDIYDNV